MPDYIEIIKNQFFSKENIDFIVQIVHNKNINIDSQQTPFNACNTVFNNFIHTVYTQKKTINPDTIEDLLITLNKLVIDIIIEESHNNFNATSSSSTSINSNTNSNTNISTKLEVSSIPEDVPQLIITQPINTILPDSIEPSKLVIETSKIKDDIQLNKESLYLFSEDSNFKDGVYTFEFRRKNIKNISLSTFDITNDLYNITDSNNKFEIIDKGVKNMTHIPIGCYNLTDLLKTVEETIVNKNVKIVYNKHKNRINIKGETPFSFKFIDDETLFIPLRCMFGFSKKEYLTNTTYASNKEPALNIYNNIYIKITNSDKFNINTSQEFKFYNRISFDYINTFGQDVSITLPYNSINNINQIDDISLELYYRHNSHQKFYKIYNKLKFLMIFDIDVVSNL